MQTVKVLSFIYRKKNMLLEKMISKKGIFNLCFYLHMLNL